MNKNPASQSGLFNPRILVAVALCSVSVLLAMLSFAATPSSGTIPQPTTITVGKKGGVAWSDTGKVGTSGGSSPWQTALACLTSTPPPQCDVYTLTFSAAADYWTAVAGPPLTGHIHTRLLQPDANTWIDLIVFDAQKNVACFSYPGRPGQEDISCDVQRLTPNATYSVVAYYEAGSGTHGYTATADLYLEKDAAPNTVENSAITFGPATWVDLQRVLGADPSVDIDMRGNGRAFVTFPWGSSKLPSTATPTPTPNPGGAEALTLPNIVARSLDRGETFRVLFDELCPTSNSQPHCGDTGFGKCRLSLSPDNDNIYLASTGQPLYTNVSVSVSANSGDTWPVFSAVPFPGQVDDPRVLAASGQTAYIAENGTFGEQYATTQNGGTTWIPNFGLPFGKWSTNAYNASQPFMDRATQSRGRGNIYQAFAEQDSNFNAVPIVGMAVSTDATATFTSYDVGADLAISTVGPRAQPWAAVDSAGNLYAVWWTGRGSDVVLSTSPISDPANDPSSTPPGKPGTKWTNPVRVSTGAAQTAVVSNIVAGSPGNVAIVYWGTDGYEIPGCQPAPDCQPSTAKWHAFVAQSSNALDSSPSFTQSRISERFIHQGGICTQAVPCMSGSPNRALRNYMSVGYDPDGRLYAAWGEDNNDGNRTEIRFAKQLTGPSLIAGKPAFHDRAPSSPMRDPSGDATWLNRISGGTNLPGADITRLAVRNDATTIQFALSVADATKFQQALSAVSPVSAVPADRLLFLVRFETADQEYFAAYEYSSGGATRAFTGRILAGDGIECVNNNCSFPYAIGFVAHNPATATVSGNTITITQKLSALDNPTKLLSVVGATLIGPSELNETRAKLLNTVDATRAFDYTLTSGGSGGNCHEADGSGDIQGKNGGASFQSDEDSCEDNDQESEQMKDPGAGEDFHSTQVQSVQFDDSLGTVTISGLGVSNGLPVAFLIVEQAATATTPAFYSIALSDGYVNSGPLVSGAITLQ